MTREEQVIEAGIDFSLRTRPMCIGGAAFDNVMRELNRNKSFEEGAKWADEHPNLYSDEKYHTVKVKDLDELNRKAKAYDKLILNTCEWLRDNMPIPEDVVESCTNNSTWYIEDFINNYRKAMEE